MKQCKRILILLLTLCLLHGYFAPLAFAEETVQELREEERENGNAVSENAEVPAANSGVCYNYTVQRVEDTLRYLKEIYIEKYPALGLRFLYGDSRDKTVFQDLADVITQGCETDREKADAIAQWIKRNIEYNESAFSFPTNALYNRMGNCLGYAVLMQTLLRLTGIPAVWGDGWRGDMETVTPEALFDTAGHAWCWAYLDGEWVLYDPLWLDEGTTDRDYMAKWLYFESIETIRPVYDTDNFPPITNSSIVCYDGTRFMVYRDGKVDTDDNTPVTINNYSLFFFVSRRWYAEGGYTDGTSYVNKEKDKDDLINGELYRDGWIQAGSMHYAYENGIQASGTILVEDGKRYYADLQSSSMFEVLASEENYSLYDGYFSVKTGYQGKPLETTAYNSFYGAAEGTETYTVKWKSDDSTVASVDENGIVTAVAPGIAFISAHFYRDSDNAYMGSSCVYGLRVSDEERIADLSDKRDDHEHVYTQIIREATCRDGYTIHTCTHEGCADSYIDSYVEAVGHAETPIPGKEATCTEGGLTEGIQCPVCGEIMTAQEETAALGHNYINGICSRCGKEEFALDGILRLSGKNRYLTAFAVADQLKENLGVEQFEAVVVAYGQNFPDALTGSYLAAVKNAPILLTEASSDASVLEYIEANLVPGGTVYILGGTAAVSQNFEDVANIMGFNAVRLKGAGRYETNLAILKEAGVNSTDEVLIATGTNYADSLSASATGLPMLLVGASLTAEQKDFLSTTSGKFVIIGGTGAVSEAVEAELAAMGSVTRVKGANRYGTSVAIAERYFATPKAAVLAYAQGFPDGLCGGPLAISMGAPLILTSNESPTAADTYVDGIIVGAVTGGTGRISDDIVRAIFDLAADVEIPKK